MRAFLSCALVVSLVGFTMMGCKGLPCPDNDDKICHSNFTGLVCNEAVHCPTGACGTCQYPGEQDDPCAEDADCASGLYCDGGVCSCIDLDEDGYGNPASAFCPYPEWDCDDSNPDVNPGATEGPDGDPTCSDGDDNDCDGNVDIDDSGCCECIDNDGDEYGDPGCENCTYPEADCLDSNPDVNPGAAEGPHGDPSCGDTIDNDCDGVADGMDYGCWPAPVEGDIMGVVVNVYNEPINDATVYLGGSDSTTTNAAGQYQFNDVPISGELPPPPFVSPLPSGIPYLIIVEAEGYTDTFTAALLDYATLEGQGAIQVVDGQIQAVGDLMTTAVTAVAREPIAHVRGLVVRDDTEQPLENVLVSLGGVPIPDPEQIWNDQRSTWAFPDNWALSDADGEVEFTNVPEGRDSYPAVYMVSYTKAGFIPLDNVTVSVGYGPHIYYIDADTGDSNPITPLRMLPGP